MVPHQVSPPALDVASTSTLYRFFIAEVDRRGLPGLHAPDPTRLSTLPCELFRRSPEHVDLLFDLSAPSVDDLQLPHDQVRPVGHIVPVQEGYEVIPE
jgi:hypothetical protein